MFGKGTQPGMDLTLKCLWSLLTMKRDMMVLQSLPFVIADSAPGEELALTYRQHPVILTVCL